MGSGVDRPSELPENPREPGSSAAERIDRFEERANTYRAEPANWDTIDPIKRLDPQRLATYYRLSGADSDSVEQNSGRTDGNEDPEAADEPEASGWDASGVADHPARPDPEHIRLTGERRQHIFDGEPGTPAGGHRHGLGKPDKTEFPERWDDDRAVEYILDVARNPDSQPICQPNRRWRLHGVRDDVDTTVIALPDGRVWTAWPEPGGRGVVRNPPEEGEAR